MLQSISAVVLHAKRECPTKLALRRESKYVTSHSKDPLDASSQVPPQPAHKRDEQPNRSLRSSDPRLGYLSSRDLAALRFIGQAGELAQYQLHEQVFRNVSEVVVSRFVRRASTRGLVATARWRGIGINRLRLTTRGRSCLVQHGISPDELFVLRNPVAEGHIEHQLWIIDTLIVLGRAARKPDLLQPAWALQRRFTPRPAAIPDVLASFVAPSEQAALLLGVEVDRGSENLASVFLPKLEKLSRVLSSWAGDAACAIVVLTNNVRRRDALRTRARPLELPVIVEMLPSVPGRLGLVQLEATFSIIR